VLLHRGEFDQALPLLKRAVSIAPKDPKIHEQLGHLYLQQDDLAEAEGEFEQSLSLDPANAALHFLLGQTYRRQGLSQKAQQEFARAAAMMGTHSGQP
jgi:Flp pilus assembly protein TadD